VAKLKADALRELKTEELEQRRAVLEEERFRLAFRRGTEPVANPLQFRAMRRDLARIATILRERKST
jgi:large subunit ribosomal protein L29